MSPRGRRRIALATSDLLFHRHFSWLSRERKVGGGGGSDGRGLHGTVHGVLFLERPRHRAGCCARARIVSSRGESRSARGGLQEPPGHYLDFPRQMGCARYFVCVGNRRCPDPKIPRFSNGQCTVFVLESQADFDPGTPVVKRFYNRFKLTTRSFLSGGVLKQWPKASSIGRSVLTPARLRFFKLGLCLLRLRIQD